MTLRTAGLLPLKGFRRWASTRPVSRPSRQPATGPPGSYPDGTHTRRRQRAYVRSGHPNQPPPTTWRTVVHHITALDELRQRGVRAGEHNRSRRRRESSGDRGRVVGVELHAHRDVAVCSIGRDELTAVLLLPQQRGHAAQSAPGLWNGRPAVAPVSTQWGGIVKCCGLAAMR